MKRINCAICDSDNFEYLYTLPKYPITQYSNNTDHSTDEFQDCIFVNCNECSCVQINTLVDPIKLYKNGNRLIDTTPTWKEHHRLFSIFVVENNTYDTILEVGGSSGPLYKLLSQTGINYIIMDITDSEKRPPEVKFIQGNCEEFDFTGYTSVVLSHTFEHLYSPRKFVERLNKACVESVFISIPNMSHLYDTKNIFILSNEHTFFVGDNEIKSLFSQFGYSCIKSYDFRTHSLFYHFRYNTVTSIVPLKYNSIRINGIKEILIHYETLMKNINIDNSCFICPAGYYGQIIYYYLQRFSKYIQGFIDNDPLRQDKRVYGTSAYVFSPNVLIKYRNTPIYIILYAGPYTDELKTQLNLLHQSIIYITF